MVVACQLCGKFIDLELDYYVETYDEKRKRTNYYCSVECQHKKEFGY